MSLFRLFKKIFFKKKPKIGLALGSGGAKGAALIGVIKAFEEEGMVFDFVSGTSIGSIVGALYSLSYKAEDMLRIFETYDLSSRVNLLKMTLSKDSLENTLDSIFQDKTFSDTYIPFRCVATEINTGEEVVMSKGTLSKALSASAAIPPVFKPVHRNGRKLIDGAFVNAVPCDVLKNLGANIVIGVTLHDQKSNEGIKKYLDIFYRGNGVKKANRLKQIDCADFVLSPPLKSFTTSDVKNFYKMYEIGYLEAKNNMEQIKSILNGKRKLKHK